MTNKDQARITKLTMMEVDQSGEQETMKHLLVGDMSRPNNNDRIYPPDTLAAFETKGHRPADPIEDEVILTPAQAKVAKAQGYRLDAIMRSELGGKILAPEEMRKRFNVFATDDLVIDGNMLRRCQPIGSVDMLAGFNYLELLDASIHAMMRRDTIQYTADIKFGLRMVSGNVVTIDCLTGQEKTIDKAGVLCRPVKDTIFPMFVNRIKTDMYPKYIIDGVRPSNAADGSGIQYIIRPAKEDDLIPLCFRMVVVSTCHGLLQIVFWGDISLEEMRRAGVYYKYGEGMYHTKFDDQDAYCNYHVIDSFSEFADRRGVTIGDPFIAIKGFDFDYPAYGGGWSLDHEEPVDKDGGHEIGKKAKEQNVDMARAAITGNGPASAIMKKLLRSK